MEVIPKLSFPEVNIELASKQTILVDVREREEVKADGKIPNSKNIPLGEIGTAMQMSDEAFVVTYGFDKPLASQTIITHCKMGIRAAKAANALSQAGFPTVKVYSGMQDWTENGGQIEK